MNAEAYCQELIETMDITKSWSVLPVEIRAALHSIIKPYKLVE
jgi:hypothetical protein